MIGRMIELYNDGGVKEVLRGVRDYLGLDVVYAKLVDEKKLVINGVEVRFVIRGVEDLKRSRGHGEVGILRDFIDEVHPEDIVWDIGANVGTYSLFAGKMGASVFAFEPASDALPRLRENIEMNSVDVSVLEMALADENGRRTLAQAEKSGHRSLSNGDGEVIQVMRGDDVDIESPDVVKIDVEGAEQEVVRGMETTLSGVRVCYVEIHSSLGVSLSDIIASMEDAGLEEKTELKSTEKRKLMKFRRI